MTEQQTILITGASRGIGAAIASQMLGLGYGVIGTYAHSEGAMTALKSQYGDALSIIQCELSEKKAGSRLFTDAAALGRPITGLVNNAAIMPETPIQSSDQQWQQDWSTIMQVNVQAVADLCRAYVLYASADDSPNEAQIVNISSRAAHRGDGPDCWHYAATKGAIMSLTRTIARAYAREGIYAYTISPGWVRTDMAAVAYEPGNEYMLDEIPMGRAAEPAEIAEMAALLLQGKCNSATGSNFDINGASHIR